MTLLRFRATQFSLSGATPEPKPPGPPAVVWKTTRPVAREMEMSVARGR
jgi:hypothetical protein